jgi:hypothetical protein
MKLIALTLLLLNLAYLGYHFSQEEAAPKRSSSANQQSANIQLLSEREGGDELDGAAVNAVENPIRSEVAVDQTSAVCFAIGPFEDVFSGQDALERINAIQVEGELRAIDVATGESDYRVLIPPARSAEEAFRKLRELQASDVDSYVITQGEQALGISLGVFSFRAGAKELSGQLTAMGYKPEIIEIQQQSRSYWIEFDSAEFQRLNDANWLANNDAISRREMICTET